MLLADAPESLTIILIVAGGVLGWMCLATGVVMVMTIFMVTGTWQWLHRWFGPVDVPTRGHGEWTNCNLYFESSHVGMNSGVGGNSRSIEVCAGEQGLILRIPMYAPVFLHLWRWQFAERLFPPCLIPYDRVTQLKGFRCQIHVADPLWPTMFVSADRETMRMVAQRTGLPWLP